eukprot:scaffold1373_cov367-Pinguiococcus_pyrenoidosus.AAC.6
MNAWRPSDRRGLVRATGACARRRRQLTEPDPVEAETRFGRECQGHHTCRDRQRKDPGHVGRASRRDDAPVQDDGQGRRDVGQGGHDEQGAAQDASDLCIPREHEVQAGLQQQGLQRGENQADLDGQLGGRLDESLAV